MPGKTLDITTETVTGVKPQAHSGPDSPVHRENIRQKRKHRVGRKKLLPSHSRSQARRTDSRSKGRLFVWWVVRLGTTPNPKVRRFLNVFRYYSQMLANQTNLP